LKPESGIQETDKVRDRKTSRYREVMSWDRSRETEVRWEPRDWVRDRGGETEGDWVRENEVVRTRLRLRRPSLEVEPGDWGWRSRRDESRRICL
jgi:hypothetical protein